MKALLFVVAIAVLLWLLFGRRRGSAPRPAPPKVAAPVAMLECAHCGLHLPQEDARRDAAGRAYCSDAHRIAGPRGGG